MSSGNKCFVCGQTSNCGYCCPGVQCYCCDEFGHFAQDCPTRFFYQEYYVTMADHVQGINTPTTRGTDHTTIKALDIGVTTADHIPTTVHNMTEAAALEGTSHALLPATITACATLQLMDAPITHCTMITTGTVTPLPTLDFLPQMALTPFHRLELLSLQWLPPCSARFSTQEDKAMPKTHNLP